jgi:hypothetical protein
MVNTVQTSKCGGLATYAVHITFFTAETGVFFVSRFPPDILLVFELPGVLALESFDTEFTRVGIRLTFGTGVPPTDFLALELINGAFLLVTNAWKFNHIFTIYNNNQKLTGFPCTHHTMLEKKRTSFSFHDRAKFRPITNEVVLCC